MRREGTSEDHARWQQHLAEYLASGEGGICAGLPLFPEQFLSGEWLGEQLLAMGMSDQQMEAICFANGQKVAFAPDPWEVTRQTLAEVKAGNAPVPGDSLSAALTEGQGLGELMLSFVERGVPPNQFRQVLARSSDEVPDVVMNRCIAEYERVWRER